MLITALSGLRSEIALGSEGHGESWWLECHSVKTQMGSSGFCLWTGSHRFGHSVVLNLNWTNQILKKLSESP